jgi:hypothetical protein
VNAFRAGSFGYIFREGAEPLARERDALSQARLSRELMRERISLRHSRGVSARRAGQHIIPLQRRKPGCGTGAICQIEKESFRGGTFRLTEAYLGQNAQDYNRQGCE